MTHHFNFCLFISFLELFSLGYVKMWHTDTWQSVLLSLRKQQAVYNYCLQLHRVAYFNDIQILGVNFVPMLNYSHLHKGVWTRGDKDPRIIKLSTTCKKVICLTSLHPQNRKLLRGPESHTDALKRTWIFAPAGNRNPFVVIRILATVLTELHRIRQKHLN